MAQFIEEYNVNDNTRILDVGGTKFNWSLVDPDPQLTLLNLTPEPERLPTNMRWCQTSGLELPFDDDSFDICFSNSVIEHLRDYESQQKFAAEIKRVSKKHYLQTPNYWFPIETHFITLFLHWLPKPKLKKLVRYFSVWAILKSPSEDEVNEMVEEIRLLKPDEMKELFPKSTLQYEWWLGMKKSIIMKKIK